MVEHISVWYFCVRFVYGQNVPYVFVSFYVYLDAVGALFHDAWVSAFEAYHTEPKTQNRINRIGTERNPFFVHHFFQFRVHFHFVFAPAFAKLDSIV